MAIDLKTNENQYLLDKYRNNNTENNIQRIPYELEHILINAIKSGNVEPINLILNSDLKNEQNTVGKMANSEEKQLEYSIVAGIAVMTRAAISGGMNPYDAFESSDIFLQRVSKLSSHHDFEAYNSIMRECIYYFCNSVKRLKHREMHSLHIEKCKAYIARHLTEAISVEDIANTLHLSPAYLSSLFKKSEKQTLKNYIIESKIESAENLLVYSDKSIVEISQLLHFSTQSYFGVVFKKCTGLSPLTYRKNHKPLSL